MQPGQNKITICKKENDTSNFYQNPPIYAISLLQYDGLFKKKISNAHTNSVDDGKIKK